MVELWCLLASRILAEPFVRSIFSIRSGRSIIQSLPERHPVRAGTGEASDRGNFAACARIADHAGKMAERAPVLIP